MKNDKLFFFIQSCLKYNSFSFGIKLRRIFYKPFFKKFGKNILIKDGTTFKYPSEIEIGDNCIIGEYCYLVGKGGLKIGNNLLMGAGSKIVTSTHNYSFRDIPIREQGLSFQSIELEDDIWLGFDVKILASAFIAKGCIIGTGAIVNDKFKEPYKIIIGAPAKIAKDRP